MDNYERHQDLLPGLRLAARDCGYALGLHGSVGADLDVIAVPWLESATSSDILADCLRCAARGVFLDAIPTMQPHGRLVWHIALAAGYIELSVLPRQVFSKSTVVAASAFTV